MTEVDNRIRPYANDGSATFRGLTIRELAIGSRRRARQPMRRRESNDASGLPSRTVSAVGGEVGGGVEVASGDLGEASAGSSALDIFDVHVDASASDTSAA
ncbi:MAG: hypothetical protein K0R99_3479 [Microbacterium sp.]|jgi:hypothetical protein|nr:hypothetical protein [Microbacterium sp.]